MKIGVKSEFVRWTVSGLLSFTCSNTRWYCTLKTRSLVSGFPEIAVISSTTRRDACGAGGFKAELLSDPNELQETAPLCWSSARRPIIRRHMSESIAARRSGSFRWRVCVKSPPSVFTLGLLIMRERGRGRFLTGNFCQNNMAAPTRGITTNGVTH